jgi:hypothetical protein
MRISSSARLQPTRGVGWLPRLKYLATRAKTGSRWWWTAQLLLAVLAYLVLALWLAHMAHTKAPWYDEGQYTNSAYDLAFHGRMGSNVVEPSGVHLNVYYRESRSGPTLSYPIT